MRQRPLYDVAIKPFLVDSPSCADNIAVQRRPVPHLPTAPLNCPSPPKEAVETRAAMSSRSETNLLYALPRVRYQGLRYADALRRSHPLPSPLPSVERWRDRRQNCRASAQRAISTSWRRVSMKRRGDRTLGQQRRRPYCFLGGPAALTDQAFAFGRASPLGDYQARAIVCHGFYPRVGVRGRHGEPVQGRFVVLLRPRRSAPGPRFFWKPGRGISILDPTLAARRGLLGREDGRGQDCRVLAPPSTRPYPQTFRPWFVCHLAASYRGLQGATRLHTALVGPASCGAFLGRTSIFFQAERGARSSVFSSAPSILPVSCIRWMQVHGARLWGDVRCHVLTGEAIH